MNKSALQLRNPLENVQIAWQKLDGLEPRLQHAAQNQLNHYTHKTEALARMLEPNKLDDKLSQSKRQLQQLLARSDIAIQRSVKDKQSSFQNAVGLLANLNPLAVLTRGYSVVTDSEGRVIHSVTQTKTGQKILTRVSDGQLEAEVTHISQPATSD